MGKDVSEPTPTPAAPSGRDQLDGWKEIAAYFRRTDRTVQRWERHEGMPVYRHLHGKQDTVWAYRSELDAWWKQRGSEAAADSSADEDEGSDVAVKDHGAPDAPTPSAETDVAVPSPRRRWLLVAATSVALVAGALLAWKYWPSPGRSGKVMVAVLPFDNLSGDSASDYFSDGLSDEMIAQLSRLQPKRLRVIAWTSARTYKHTTKSAALIGRELAVDYLLEGSVSRAGDRVRIRAQLIQVGDQTNLWADTYEGDLRDVLALQGGVARDVAEQIQVQLTPQEKGRLANAPVVSPAAYEAYLKGRFYWNKRTSEDLQQSVAYFEQAIRIDAKYAPAYAGLADSYGLMGTIPYDVLPPKNAMPECKAAAQRALALDESLAEAHVSLAYVEFAYDWNWPVAEKEFRRAIELNPNYATAHQWYALSLVSMGRTGEATSEIALA